jgi:MoaA/NifB/PqqE/SkfB family radical SAM enzyme
MCNIWRAKPHEDLCVENYEKLPGTLKNVNVTGGEALLRKDFFDIVTVIYESCGRPRIIISTNGFRSKKTVTALVRLRDRIPGLGVGVSIDGIGAMHNKMRGVREAYTQSIKTIRMLRERGFEDLRISFTGMNENLAQMPEVYNLADSLSVYFAVTVAQNSEIYYQIDTNHSVDLQRLQQSLDYVISRELRSFNYKKWFRAYFNSGILKFVQQRKRLARCNAGVDFFYLAPEGEIYPCLTIPKRFGNLKEESFCAIWNGSRAQAIRQEIHGCEQCWMVCTARTELKRQLPKALWWVMRHKLEAHVSRSTTHDG